MTVGLLSFCATVSGFTSIVPIAPTQAPSGNGSTSRLIYVSSSTGNDTTGDGTQGNPFASIAKGLTFLRDGFPDQLLMKRGDTFTNDPLGQLSLRGVAPSTWNPGGTMSGPILIGAYGSGARPLLSLDSAHSQPAVSTPFSATNWGSDVAIIGLEFYCSTRDPANGAIEANQDAFGISTTSPFTNFLLEDCKLSFFSTNLDFTCPAGGRHTNLAVRRNVVINAYSNLNHTQGMHMGEGDSVLIEENVFDGNGWSQVLSAAYSVTISQATPGVVTWPSLTGNWVPYAGAILFPSSTGGGLTAGTGVMVVNVSGHTFNVATINDLSLSGGAASWSAGKATFTTPSAHSISVGDPVTVAGFGPSNLWNGVFTAVSPTSGNTVTVTMASNPGNGSNLGKIAGKGFAISSGVVSPQNFAWQDPCANIFSRNFYLADTNGPVTAKGNLSANSGAEGCQFRSGGTVYDNLFVANSNGFDLGHLESSPQITFADVRRNVILHSRDILSVPSVGTRGDGINVFNAHGSNIQIDDNIIAHGSSTGTGIILGNDVSPGPVTNVNVGQRTPNIVFDYTNTLSDLGAPGAGNLTTGNTFHASNTNDLGVTDTTRTVESYNVTLGGASTLTDFLAQARLQSSQNWRTQYMATAVVTYVRQGFNLT